MIIETIQIVTERYMSKEENPLYISSSIAVRKRGEGT
tara:strand:+ start:98 stop:208 length:111 start_codon:yes stop_codon:yes gene_type:complete